MRSVANVVVVGSLCAIATERGWGFPLDMALWLGFVLALFVSMMAEEPPK